MIPGWVLVVDSVLGDFAFVGAMVAWARKRNRDRMLSNWDTRTATPVVDDVLARLSRVEHATPAQLRQAQFITTAAKRIANSQAFYYLAVAARNPESYLHREMKSFLQVFSRRRSEAPAPAQRSFLQF